MTDVHPLGSRRLFPSGMTGMVLLSAALHVAAFALVLASPSLPSPRWTFGPVYSVQLVSSPGAAQQQTAGSALSRQILDTPQREDPFSLKKRVEADTAVPIKRLDAPKAEKKTADRAVEDLRRRLAEDRPSPSPPPAGQGASRSTAARETGAGTGAVVNAYYAQIWSRIRGNWVLPQGLLSADPWEAIVQVRIQRDGSIADLRFEKTSGNRLFDASVLRAVQKSAPFPPLPASFGASSIDLGIRFRPLELLS